MSYAHVVGFTGSCQVSRMESAEFKAIVLKMDAEIKKKGLSKNQVF